MPGDVLLQPPKKAIRLHSRTVRLDPSVVFGFEIERPDTLPISHHLHSRPDHLQLQLLSSSSSSCAPAPQLPAAVACTQRDFSMYTAHSSVYTSAAHTHYPSNRLTG